MEYINHSLHTSIILVIRSISSPLCSLQHYTFHSSFFQTNALVLRTVYNGLYSVKMATVGNGVTIGNGDGTGSVFAFTGVSTAPLPSVTLASSASLPSATGCTQGLLPNLPSVSDAVCAVGTDTTKHTASEAVDAMRKCCGDSAIYILDGGCGLACTVSQSGQTDLLNCLTGEIRGVECNGGSETIVSSNGVATTIGQTLGGSSTTSGATSTSSDSSATNASDSAAAATSSDSGAAPRTSMEVTTKGGLFAVGLLAMSFFSGALLL